MIDIIDGLLTSLGINDGPQKGELRAKIVSYTFERALVRLDGQLSEDEAAVLKPLAEQPLPETGKELELLFSNPAHRDTLIESFVEVVNDVVDGANLSATERQAVLGKLESVLEQQQVKTELQAL